MRRGEEVVPDSALIARSLGEDRAAFAEIFDRHFDRVHAYLSHRHGVDVADDLASETFTRAVAARRSFDLRRAGALPWLLGIAVNVSRRHLRWEYCADEVPLDDAALEVDDHADRVATRIDVGIALAAITSEYRDALTLFLWADLTYEQISEALGVPVGTVRSRIARGRREFRELIRSPDEAHVYPAAATEPTGVAQ